MKIHIGTPSYGWWMYGIGYKDMFLGFCMRRNDWSVWAKGKGW